MKIDPKLTHNLENKTILITGSAGMLGLAFTEILEGMNIRMFCFPHKELDVTDKSKVLSLSNLKPDIIIHCAANVDADFCEDNPEICYLTQVMGTQNIIDLAKSCSSKIFYPQSFLIFDDRSGIITELTTPIPLSVYGRYKLEAEEILLKDSFGHLIVRMGGMFGGYEKDKNFIGKFSRHISELIKKNIKSQNVGDRIWQPTYTKDLAYNSLVLLSEGKKGVYNMASHGEASFFDVAEEIVKHFELEIIINKISSKDFVEKAKRPEKAVLSNSKLESEGLDLQRDWKTGLHDYLDNDYFRRLFL